MNTNNISSIISFFLFWLYGLFHPIQKKVVFSSFFGKQYSDNPRAICERFHELYPDYELVWLLNNKSISIIPDYVRVVSKKDRFFAWGREITTAASYIYNVEIQTKIFRKSSQSFIQTWHGDRAIKKILKDRNPAVVVYDNALTTLCVAGSMSGSQLYRSAFSYDGTVMSTGCPRNDCLFHEDFEKKQKIKNCLGIPYDSKVILYAPTFRDNKRDALQESNIDIIDMLNAFPKNEKWICLMRAHVATLGLACNYQDNRILDVTQYPDMADILCITDFLVSDYSSCATDFAVTGKPIVLTLFDKKEYQEQCRDFFVEPEEAGFIVAYDQNMLRKIIKNTSTQQYAEACQKVNSYYGVMETGHASEDVCRYIDEYYNKKRFSHNKK